MMIAILCQDWNDNIIKVADSQIGDRPIVIVGTLAIREVIRTVRKNLRRKRLICKDQVYHRLYGSPTAD